MATVPTQTQIQRAILDEILSSNVRSGEIFQPLMIQLKLDKVGIRSKEFYDALGALGELGYFENSNSPKFLKLTDAGFAAL